MKVSVLGGGLAGISSALHLNPNIEVEIFERESRLGGLLKTDHVDGFLYDFGPHLFFHQDPLFIETFDKAVSSVGIEKRMAKTGQFSFGKLIDFPYAMHLRTLPADVVSKCMIDFVNCRINEAKADYRPVVRTYEDYCRVHFGNGFTDHFMIPYAQKIWTVHPRMLDIDWVGQRIVLPELKEMIIGALSPRTLSGNYIKEFRYPKTGGSESFIKGLVAQFGKNIKVQSSVEIKTLHLKQKKLEDASGNFFYYEKLISSVPLPELKTMIPDLPTAIKDAIDKLKWFGVMLFNYGGTTINPNSYQWVYFDQSDHACHRIHYPSKLADHMVQEKNQQSIQAEISFSKFRELPGTESVLTEKIWGELRNSEFVNGTDVPIKKVRKIEYAYAIMDHERKSAVAMIRDYLESHGIFTCGRFGEWDYIWTDKVLHSGINAAAKANVSLS